MRRDLIRKAVSVGFIGLAVVVLVSLLHVASGHSFADSLNDKLILVSPIIATSVSALFGILLYPTPRTSRPVKRGLLWGAFVGTNGFLIVLALSLFPHLELVSQDGTAYWGCLFIPSFWIGIPSLIVGAILGLVVGLIMNKKRGKEDIA